MGKGDKKSRKGKIFRGSHGNSHLRKKEVAYKPKEVAKEK